MRQKNQNPHRYAEAFLLEPLVFHVLGRSRVLLSLPTSPSTLARSVPKAGAPNCDTPPLTTASEATGNELPPYLPPARKRFSVFFLTLQI